MWWTTLKWVFFGIALAMLGGNSSKAEPIPRSDDMFRELIKLDQLYSSIARPSLRSVPISSEVTQKVQRALNMLRLQQLDNMYSTRSRPRFGKRTNQLPIGNNVYSEAVETNKMQFRNEDDESERDWLPPLRR